jgi:hypothetical protein
MSHGTADLYPLNAASNVIVFVSMVKVIPDRVAAPIGKACNNIKDIVAEKIAKRCHACELISSGCGENHIPTPRRKQTANFRYCFIFNNPLSVL